MPNVSKTTRKQDRRPVIFISHATEDAPLAEAFARLLMSLSAGQLKCFIASDLNGRGIEFGLHWHTVLKKELKSATDVVCLLTRRGLKSHWVPFEAGFATGRTIPFHGIDFGGLLREAITSPFAHVQSCDNTDASLTGLILQLLRRLPAAEPNEGAVLRQVCDFRNEANELLAKLDEQMPQDRVERTPVLKRLEAGLFIERVATANDITILNTYIPNLEDCSEALEQALKRRANVRILMVNPHSRASELRNNALSISGPPRVTLGVQRCLEQFRAIAESVPEESRRCLQVKLYNSLPSMAVYRADDKIFAGLFLHDHLAINGPQFDVQGPKSILGEHISKELETVWNLAYEIKDVRHWRTELEGPSPMSAPAPLPGPTPVPDPKMMELNEFEDRLTEEFRNHEVLRQLGRFSREDFLGVLLQRRFISFAFTTIYDFAIDALQDPTAKVLASRILREEYPSNDLPSHREDLFRDLEVLGATRQQIISSKPTETTTEVIKRSIALVTDLQLGPLSDVAILTALRFLGEIAVGVEYQEYWRRMSMVFADSGRNASRFFHPHLDHDSKDSPLGETSVRSPSHSDRLGARLKELMSTSEAQDLFILTAKDALGVRMRFYDQFSDVVARSKQISA